MSDLTNDLLNGPEWKSHLTWNSLFLNDTFPSGDNYFDSFWHTWEGRVKSGQQQEEDRLDQLLKKRPAGDDTDLTVADEFWRVGRVTNAMSAALIVALWSNMENLLKGLITTSQKGLGQAANPPFKFHLIKEFFATNLGIDLVTLPGYATIDAVRLLNNSFKHSDGHYHPEAGKAHTEIQAALANQLGITADTAIEYEKLPMKLLVGACGDFSSSLVAEVGKQLEART